MNARQPEAGQVWRHSTARGFQMLLIDRVQDGKVYGYNYTTRGTSGRNINVPLDDFLARWSLATENGVAR